MLWTEKLNLLNQQCFYRNSVLCQKLQPVFEEQSFGLDTGSQLFCNSFIVLSITRCSKSAQKFAVWVHQFTTVTMANTQLVLNRLKKLFIKSIKNWIRSLSLPKVTSKRCELVKLCHIIRSSPVFWDTVYNDILSDGLIVSILWFIHYLHQTFTFSPIYFNVDEKCCTLFYLFIFLTVLYV